MNIIAFTLKSLKWYSFYLQTSRECNRIRDDWHFFPNLSVLSSWKCLATSEQHSCWTKHRVYEVVPLGGLTEKFSQSKGKLVNVRWDMPITIRKVMTQRGESANLTLNSIYEAQFSCYWFHLFIFGINRDSCRTYKLICS